MKKERRYTRGENGRRSASTRRIETIGAAVVPLVVREEKKKKGEGGGGGGGGVVGGGASSVEHASFLQTTTTRNGGKKEHNGVIRNVGVMKETKMETSERQTIFAAPVTSETSEDASSSSSSLAASSYRKIVLRRRDENIIMSTHVGDVNIDDLNRLMYETCGIEPRDPEKWRVALEHSSAIVVAFSVPLKAASSTRRVSSSLSKTTPSPLESIKATAQQILKNSGSNNNVSSGGRDSADTYATAGARNTKRQLVGFARAYSDGAFSAMISDVAIDDKYKKGEVGKKVVSLLIDQLKSVGIGSFAAMVPGYSQNFFHDTGFRETYLRALRFRNDHEEEEEEPASLGDKEDAKVEAENATVPVAETVSTIS